MRKLILEEEDDKLGDAIRIGAEDGMQDFTHEPEEPGRRRADRPRSGLGSGAEREALKMALKGIEVRQPGIL